MAFSHRQIFSPDGYSDKSRGFTLVELAIVITIVGLLIGGILKGQEMIKNARVTSTISQATSYQAALETFRDRFDQSPGDMSVAQARLPGCSAATHCYNGQGNSLIGNPTTGGGAVQAGVMSLPQLETTMFWKHLALADLISGIDPGADPETPVWGKTHPASKFAGGFEVFTDRGSAAGTSLRLQSALTSGASPLLSANSNPVNPAAAAQIDRKMDDGKANTGYVWAIPRVNDDGVTGCANTSGAYYETSHLMNCIVHIKISR